MKRCDGCKKRRDAECCWAAVGWILITQCCLSNGQLASSDPNWFSSFGQILQGDDTVNNTLINVTVSITTVPSSDNTNFYYLEEAQTAYYTCTWAADGHLPNEIATCVRLQWLVENVTLADHSSYYFDVDNFTVYVSGQNLTIPLVTTDNTNVTVNCTLINICGNTSLWNNTWQLLNATYSEWWGAALNETAGSSWLYFLTSNGLYSVNVTAGSSELWVYPKSYYGTAIGIVVGIIGGLLLVILVAEVLIRWRQYVQRQKWRKKHSSVSLEMNATPSAPAEKRTTRQAFREAINDFSGMFAEP